LFYREMNMLVLKKLIIGLIFIILIQIDSYSQDSVKQSKIVFNGYVKDLQNVLFQNIQDDWIFSNIVHNRLNFKWLISPSFRFAAEARTRFVQGNMLSSLSGYNKTFETDNGIISLTKNIFDEKSFLLNVAVDRLWLEYSSGKFQLTLGRQRINWGQTFVWNPNDIFNAYSYFDFDYEERPGSDALRIQYFPGSTSVFEVAAKVDHNKNLSAAALYRFNKWNYDFQFLGGYIGTNNMVLGTGWAGQILKGGFRGEATYFHPIKNFMGTRGILTAAIGYDYSFRNSVFLQVEALYNGNYDSTDIYTIGLYNNNVSNTNNVFLSDFSVFVSASYPFTPIFSGSLAGIVNFKNKMIFILPTLNISLKDNLDLAFTSQVLQKYSGKTKNGIYLFFARMKWSF